MEEGGSVEESREEEGGRDKTHGDSEQGDYPERCRMDTCWQTV